MGAGIAKEIHKRFPLLFVKYKRLCEAGKFPLGSIFTWHEEDDLTIFNLATQPDLNGATMEAIESSLKKMVKAAEILKYKSIGLPKIGAGLGGLEWEPIKQILTDLGSKSTVDLIVFEEYIPGHNPLKS